VTAKVGVFLVSLGGREKTIRVPSLKERKDEKEPADVEGGKKEGEGSVDILHQSSIIFNRDFQKIELWIHLSIYRFRV
jgi:hypothetical protein